MSKVLTKIVQRVISARKKRGVDLRQKRSELTGNIGNLLALSFTSQWKDIGRLEYQTRYKDCHITTGTTRRRETFWAYLLT